MASFNTFNLDRLNIKLYDSETATGICQFQNTVFEFMDLVRRGDQIVTMKSIEKFTALIGNKVWWPNACHVASEFQDIYTRKEFNPHTAMGHLLTCLHEQEVWKIPKVNPPEHDLDVLRRRYRDTVSYLDFLARDGCPSPVEAQNPATEHPTGPGTLVEDERVWCDTRNVDPLYYDGKLVFLKYRGIYFEVAAQSDSELKILSKRTQRSRKAIVRRHPQGMGLLVKNDEHDRHYIEEPPRGASSVESG